MSNETYAATLELMLTHLEGFPTTSASTPAYIREYAEKHSLPLNEERLKKAAEQRYTATLEEMLTHLEEFPTTGAYTPENIRAYVRQHGLPLDEERLRVAEARRKAS